VDTATLFSDDELRAIEQAAAGAERRTSGEIVPYVVGACDEYRETTWKAAVLGAVLGGAVGVAVHFLGGFWGGSPWLWFVLPATLTAGVAAAASRSLSLVRRLLVPDAILDLRARRRAALAFLDEEVFATRDRTGILIFVALFERRVVVLGDAGINRAVPDGAWQGIVTGIVRGIRDGRTAASMVAAIQECGRLLEAHRVEIRPDDTDELDNRLRLRDR
jgi:putative membrane protein